MTKKQDRMFIATQDTQGQRENDFNWCEEGEPLTFGTLLCSRGSTDDHCGCHRSLTGIHSLKATTTMKVVTLESVFPQGRDQFVHALLRSLHEGGWTQPIATSPVLQYLAMEGTRLDTDIESLRYAQGKADLIITYANHFEVGTVVELRDEALCER